MNYFEITYTEIYNNKEILKDFLKLYSEKTGELSLNAGCEKCIYDYQKKLYNIMEGEKKTYLFNEKYNGMFWKNDYITNINLTEIIANEILTFYADELITERFAKYPLEKTNKTKQNKTNVNESGDI
jgi:hypothetical protein